MTRGALPIGTAVGYAQAAPRGAPLRAPARDHPPRHQAAQRARLRRPARKGERAAAQGDRLRHRAARRVADDRGRLDHGHGAVPLAGAGPRGAGDGGVRPLLDRRRPLRDAHRQGAVHGRLGDRDRHEARERAARAAVQRCRPEIPAELDQIVLRALAKDPADRYQTAEEFIEDLERVEAGLPISRATSTAATALLAGAAGGWRRARRPSSCRRGRRAWWRHLRPRPRRRGARPPTRLPARTTSRPRRRRRWVPVAPGRAADRRRGPGRLVGVQPDPGAARGDRRRSACRSSRDSSRTWRSSRSRPSASRPRSRSSPAPRSSAGSSSSRARRRARRSPRAAP